MDGETTDEPMEGRCSAHTTSGRPCRNFPMDGATVCRKHGGGAPQVRLAAAARLEDARARSLLAKLERPEPINHPVIELLELGAEMKAWMSFMRGRAAELAEEDRLEHFDEKRAIHERAAVLLYERSIDRLAKLLVEFARLDLEARRQRLAENDAALVESSLRCALGAVGLDDRIPDVLRAFAQCLGGGAAPPTRARPELPGGPGEVGE